MFGYAGGHEVIAAPSATRERSTLTAEALQLVGELAGRFRERIADLLAQRRERERRFDAGDRPGYGASTAWIRESEWHCAAVPPAFRSAARLVVAGVDTAARERRDPAVAVVVKLRGLHVFDPQVAVNGRPAPAALVDAGVYLFHHAHDLAARGNGPHFYLPDVQSYQEAQLWNDLFLFAQRSLGLPAGTIKVIVQIDTRAATFQMDEILYALRRHAAGLHGLVLGGASESLVETCRRRGVLGRNEFHVAPAQAATAPALVARAIR
jgi:malate synthase